MSDDLRLETLFEFVESCLAQAKDLSQRDTGRLFGATTSEKGRALYVAFQQGRKKTVGELVPILSGLRNNIQTKYLDSSEEVEHPMRLISAEHIYLALQKLIALTPEEKESLGLPVDDCETLLNQAFLNMALYQRPWNEERLLAIYRTSTSLPQVPDQHSASPPTRATIDAWIKEVAESFQKEQLGYSLSKEQAHRQGAESVQDKAPVEKMKAFEKVTREINRILIKTGASQLKLKGLDSKADYIGKYLPYSFIKRLTQSVFENELLTEELAIFIKNVTVERCGPFPLQVANTFADKGFLSRPLLDFTHKQHTDPDYTELASHTVNKVTVQMHMRLREGASEHQPNPFASTHLIREGSRGRELHFEFNSTGIGGTFSHVVKVLNFILLYDIACLSDYFPIAHEVMMEQDIVRSGAPAPVIAHSLVNLSRVATLVKAMRASQRAGVLKPYEYFSFNDPIGRGDFCGFDTLTSVANASLQARLKAIKLTGISPQKYLTDLQESVNRYFLLRKARAYLSEYPFSALAQQSFLDKSFGSGWDTTLTPESSYVYFEMQLTVIESFLIEGMYERAAPYLEKLTAVLETISTQGIAWYRHFGEDIELDEAQSFKVFSGTLLVRYELCQAHNHYLAGQPTEAWERLNRAEEHVNVRLAKYSLIKEVSQATFHPHYWLLSKIYFLRARLLMFFPFSPPIDGSNQHLRIPTDTEHGDGHRTIRAVHVGRLYLIEKARLYAACNGDSELYACMTAYQCCTYLITAESGVLPMQKFGPRDFALSEEQAKDWALRSRNQALLSYAEAGRQYYYQIKEKSGISKQRHHNFGEFEIGAVPAIREKRGNEELGIIEYTRKGSEVSEKILYLDMSILGVDENRVRGIEGPERGDTIYLFGTNACYLFFARGMYHLCSDEVEEFGEKVAVSSIEEWATKLAYAYRLFSYAWAIADDGGNISVDTTDDTEFTRVERSFSVPEHVASYEKDVASIRDLYPHRITDIASLGRLYAAACTVLRGYTTTDLQKRQQYQTQLHWLLSNLHGEETCQKAGTQKILGNQERYNEHLALYLRRCRRHIERKWESVEQSPVLSTTELKQHRKELLKSLFALKGKGA